MLERRKSVRIPKSLAISYKRVDKPGVHTSLTRNVSQGGIDFFAHNFIPLGTILKIKFSLTEFSYDGLAKVIWIKEVIHNEKYEVGAKFTNMPEASETD